MDKNKENLVETLTRGRDSAKKLQNLLRRKVDKDGSDSVDNLVMEVMGSFAGGLSVLNSFHRVPVSPRVDLTCSVDRIPEFFSGETGKSQATGVKQRRGCYMRRRAIDSRAITSGTIKDGYAWRKYGQKEILNSKFPRWYFRCTHKHVLGCKALKQVQKLDDEPNMFRITYFGHHTCSTSHISSHHEVTQDRTYSKIYQSLPNNPSTSTNVHIDPSLEQDLSSPNNNRSLSALVWKEILIEELESFRKCGSLSDIPFPDHVFLS